MGTGDDATGTKGGAVMGFRTASTAGRPLDVLVKLGTEHGIGSWILDFLWQDGAWRQESSMAASPGTGVPLKELVQRDGVSQWVAAKLGVRRVCLQLTATMPHPVWRVTAQQLK